MIEISLRNLLYFLPQYIIASLVAAMVFNLLRKSRPSERFLNFLWAKDNDRVSNRSFALYSSDLSEEKERGSFFSLELEDRDVGGIKKRFQSNGLSCPVTYQGRSMSGIILLSRLYNSDPESIYEKSTSYVDYTKFQKLSVYDNELIFDAYSSIFSISIWGGILLLLTPYSRLYFFLPHFSTSTNLLVSIILGITIFESSISNIVFHVGNSKKWIFRIELIVFAFVTLSLLTPSMSWVRNYDFVGVFEVYLIILIMVLLITYLIFQLSNKRSVFLLSLYSSIISYSFFISVITFNILDLVLRSH